MREGFELPSARAVHLKEVVPPVGGKTSRSSLRRNTEHYYERALAAGTLIGMQDSDDIARACRKMEAAAEVSRWIWCVNLAAAVVALALKRFDAATLALVTTLLAVTAAGLTRRAAMHLRAKERASAQTESEVDETSTRSDHRRSHGART